MNTTTSSGEGSTDRVWITYGGSCFHSTPDCPALAEGQAKARASGFQAWRVVSTTPARAQGRRRCLVCHDSSDRSTWNGLDDSLLRIAHGNGRSAATIAGMLDRPEAQVQARIAQLGLGRLA